MRQGYALHSFCYLLEKDMTSIARFYVSLAVVTSLFQACSDAPKGDDATISEKQEASAATGQSFAADTAISRIRFNGRGVGKNHPGVFKLSSGTVAVANDQITGGNFVINIKSMELEQKGGMFDEKLRPHLMSGDFFDADKFGTAKFEITKVEPYQPNKADSSIVEGANFNISGNFTLKDVTKNITFPARVDLDGNTLKAKGNFDIDRRQWNMNYGNDKTLGDKFISETVNIELDLQARKQ
jgi:polyisoprenoid-binding protein YceI